MNGQCRVYEGKIANNDYQFLKDYKYLQQSDNVVFSFVMIFFIKFFVYNNVDFFYLNRWLV